MLSKTDHLNNRFNIFHIHETYVSTCLSAGYDPVVPTAREVRLQPSFPGGRTSPVLLEQRVYHVSHQRQRFSHPANHVPGIVQE